MLSMPVAAQGDPLRGVWTGTVGNMAVHACFNGDDGDGVYYHDRHKALIFLDNEQGEFAERVGYDDPSGSCWHLSRIGDARASGAWHEAGRQLPIELSRVAWTARDEFFDSPCESMAFMGPRLGGGSLASEAAEIAGQGYTVLRYVPPAHFDADDIFIQTFALPGSGLADARINHALAFDLPRGDVSDEFAECFGMHAAFRGMDGYFYKHVQPELLTDRWLGDSENNSLYCGGAHPSHWSLRRVFDRYDGEEVDPATWLNDSALDRRVLAPGPDASVYATVADAFMPVLLRNWFTLPEGSAEEDVADRADCIEIAGRTQGWDFGLAEDGSGMAFIPQVPHVATPCAETVVVDWAQLEPFLTIEGQAVASSFTKAD